MREVDGTCATVDARFVVPGGADVANGHHEIDIPYFSLERTR
jgi:hypothetical protein